VTVLPSSVRLADLVDKRVHGRGSGHGGSIRRSRRSAKTTGHAVVLSPQKLPPGVAVVTTRGSHVGFFEAPSVALAEAVGPRGALAVVTTLSVGNDGMSDGDVANLGVPTVAFVHLFLAANGPARDAIIAAVWATVEAAKREISGNATVRSTMFGFDFERGLDLIDVEEGAASASADISEIVMADRLQPRAAYLNAQLVESTGRAELARVFGMAPTQDRAVEVNVTPHVVEFVHVNSHATILSVPMAAVEYVTVAGPQSRLVAIVALSAGTVGREQVAHILEFMDPATAADVVSEVSANVDSHSHGRTKVDTEPTLVSAKGPSTSPRDRQIERMRGRANSAAGFRAGPRVRIAHIMFVGVCGIKFSASASQEAKIKSADAIIQKLRPTGGGIMVALVSTIDRLMAINPLTAEVLSASPLRRVLWMSTCGGKKRNHLAIITSDAMSGRRTCLLFKASTPTSATAVYKLVSNVFAMAQKMAPSDPFTAKARQRKKMVSPKGLKHLELDRRRLKPQRVIGAGAFGEVYRATYRKGGVDQDVAVKVLREKPGTVEHAAFVRECLAMAAFSTPTICSIVGCVLSDQPCLLVTELHRYGDLRNILLQCDDKAIQLTATESLMFLAQVAAALQYIAEKLYCHVDVACRNILVGDNNRCALADFGLARGFGEAGYSFLDEQVNLPIRWLAPETLDMRRVSTASDVWSFGVAMWEVFTSGKIPFEGLSSAAIQDGIRGDLRLPQPPGCSAFIFAVMQSCWAAKSENRLPMIEVNERVRSLLRASRVAGARIRDVGAAAVLNKNQDVDPARVTELVSRTSLTSLDDFGDDSDDGDDGGDGKLDGFGRTEQEAEYIVVGGGTDHEAAYISIGEVPGSSTADELATQPNPPQPCTDIKKGKVTTKSGQSGSTKSRIGSSNVVTVADVGKKCTVEGYPCDGIIRFIGVYAVSGKLRCGVELAKPIGKNNGVVKGKRYFRCKPLHGVLVVPSKVAIMRIDANRAQAPPLPNKLTSERKHQKGMASCGNGGVRRDMTSTIVRKPKTWACAVQ